MIVVEGRPAQRRRLIGACQRVDAVPAFEFVVGGDCLDDNDAKLMESDFRPLRSPIPLIAIRSIVVEDTPFALHHLLLLPVYITRFPKSGSKHIMARLRAGMFQRAIKR